MASPLQFAYRTQKAIGLFDADPVYEALPGFATPEGNLRCCVYSPCGRYFASASSDGVSVADASTGSVITSLVVSNVFELGFSPRGSYLSTWERPAKDDNGDATKNLKVWRVVEDLTAGDEKQPIGRFVQKSQSGWNLQYTSDERFCARAVTNEIQFYESGDLATVSNKLRVEGVTDFALAPGQTHSVAVFIPERKGQPAAVQVYNVPQFTSPVSQKTFFKGDKVQLKWNVQGTSLIVLAQTDVDKSNKSYYGETTLYLLSAGGGFDARVTLDKEGPIHDVSWSPNSKEFGVIYGFMPAKATIFNHRAVATHSFPIGPRNTIIFSPTGRFALIAGFGNLAGQIDVYDMEKDNTKVCTIESGNPSVCQWSPDSRFIMTATTSPRLRVDNGIKLWHVGGGLIYNEDMVELYNVLWRPRSAVEAASTGPDPLRSVPTPHASAIAYLGTIKTPSKPSGAYRPPGARGTSTPLHFKREDEGGAAHIVSNGTSNIGPNGFGRPRRMIPGAELVEGGGAPRATPPGGVPGAEVGDGSEILSKAALKNKKKRGNKKAKEAEANANDGSGANGGGGGGGASLAPPREPGHGYGPDSRSPERRGHFHSRSQSRHNGQGGRNRSNTQRNRDEHSQLRGQGHHPGANEFVPGSQYHMGGAPSGVNGGNGVGPHAGPQPTVITSPVAGPVDSGSPAGQSANAKKIRSLQKKIRAIEDLEMRRAGGEKLEDTQVKKIETRSSVVRELEALEREL